MANSRSRRLVLLATLVFAAGTGSRSSSAQTSPAPTLQNDPAHPSATQGWVETELFFGLGPAGSFRNVHAWSLFLDHEVTPRFPAGLSVVDLYGQWQGQHDPRPARIHSMLLILVYPDTPENAASIDALRSAWKQKTGDQSVLKVTRPVDVSF